MAGLRREEVNNLFYIMKDAAQGAAETLSWHPEYLSFIDSQKGEWTVGLIEPKGAGNPRREKSITSSKLDALWKGQEQLYDPVVMDNGTSFPHVLGTMAQQFSTLPPYVLYFAAEHTLKNVSIAQDDSFMSELFDQGRNYVKQYRHCKDRVVEENLGLANIFANKFTWAMPFEDAAQLGYEGLIRATETYDPKRNIAFSTYSVYWIKAKIKRGVENTASLIRRPVDEILKNHAVQTELEWYTQKLGRELTLEEQEEIRKDHNTMASRGAYDGRRVTSLQQPMAGEDDFSLEDTLGDLPTQFDATSQKLDRERLFRIMNLLIRNPRTKEMVFRRMGFYGEEETLTEIGKRFGIGGETVRQQIGQAVKKMHFYCRRQGLEAEDFLSIES